MSADVTVSAVSDLTPRAESASIQLHERLRLSARMLKAFQSQMHVAEAAVDQAQAQQRAMQQSQVELERTLHECEGSAEETLRQFDMRIEHIATQAMQRIERVIEQRLEDLSRFDQRVAHLAPRVEQLAAMVESAEVNIAVLAHRSGSAMTRCSAQADQAARVIEHCRQARNELTQDLNDADERIENLAGRIDNIADQVEQRIKHLEAALASTITAISDRAEHVDNAGDGANASHKPPDGGRPDMLDQSDSHLAAADLKATSRLVETMLSQMKDVIRLGTAVRDATSATEATEASTGTVAAMFDEDAATTSSGA